MSTTAEGYNYTELSDPHARFAFFDRVLEQGANQTVEDTLSDLIGYIGYLSGELEAVGCTQVEAQETAADVVFSGISKHMNRSGTPYHLKALEEMDRTIRGVHDILDVTFPNQHDDPLVASFYRNLEGHLLRRLPGDRTDPWGSYHD